MIACIDMDKKERNASYKVMSKKRYYFVRMPTPT